MIEIIKRGSWRTSQWAGGETNELYIYPPESSYKDRSFKARISVASTREDSESKFTSLPGINRFISVLEGEMHLTFEGRHDRKMKKFNIENFSGDWNAVSLGKYVDFNLMLQNVEGDLYFYTADGEFTLNLEKEVERMFIFVVEGEVSVAGNTVESYELLITDQSKLTLRADNANLLYGYFK